MRATKTFRSSVRKDAHLETIQNFKLKRFFRRLAQAIKDDVVVDSSEVGEQAIRCLFFLVFLSYTLYSLFSRVITPQNILLILFQTMWRRKGGLTKRSLLRTLFVVDLSLGYCSSTRKWCYVNSSPLNSSCSIRRVLFVAGQFVAHSIRRIHFVAFFSL